MKIYSWGSNSRGQLGQGSEAEQVLVPVPVNITVEPKFITGGGKHTILLTKEGEIFSCGDNDKGQLGKDFTIKLINTFQYLSVPFKILKVSCGWDFNLILTDNGEVFAWGSNLFGQLGLPVNKVKHLCSPFKIFEKASDIAAGLRHSAVVTSKGLVFTSGYGRKGQLGIFVNESIPTEISEFTLVKNIHNCLEISCGECHCVAKTADNKYYSWGNNKYGQLGLDPAECSLSPTPIQVKVCSGSEGNSQLFSGWAHNVILTETGHVISWGRNDFGQLGEERQFKWKPQLVKNLTKVKQVCLGSHHSVLLTEDGIVLTWGWNEHGNCGNGSCENVLEPYKLQEFSDVKLIGSGAAHSFLLSCEKELLEIGNPNVEPTQSNEILSAVPVIENIDYSTFFERYLLPNTPCIINNATRNWHCITKWIKNKSLNTEYFRRNLRDTDVPVSDCGRREFNVQKKYSMKLFDYLNYWEKYNKCSEGMDCLYLKDWHFMKQFPQEEVYRVPSYFASDWLNEYYDNNLNLNDDYRFVYIGPKGSWTPLHADVFNSYSWSVNICGKKKWILFPPGAENNFRDNLGNLMYNIDMTIMNQIKNNKVYCLEVIQEEGQGLFVPSGWHHQVWNLEDTISVNHNWINGCNIHYIWNSLNKNLAAVMKEILDCKDMENWTSQCQLILSASFGFNYQFFHSFLTQTAKTRIEALKANRNVKVYGNWSFGENHMKFDLKRILTVLRWLERDENFLEISKIENSLNHTLEFVDSLTAFLNSN